MSEQQQIFINQVIFLMIFGSIIVCTLFEGHFLQRSENVKHDVHPRVALDEVVQEEIVDSGRVV